jgi:class 3 adenylate cyclase
LLARLLDAANEAVRLHAGELERFGPEGLVAVFGADVSREDDALRAVRAGVELHERAGVGVGVATGDAVIADEPRVAGAAVARAAGRARVGKGGLLDPRTQGLGREWVTFETAGPGAP